MHKGDKALTTPGCMLVCDCKGQEGQGWKQLILLTVFAGYLVSNRPLTEAKCPSCHPYCVGHSRTRVTLWSPWASGAHAVSMAGRERPCLGRGGSALQEEDSGGRFLLSLVLPDLLLAQVLGFREDLEVWSFPSSALEMASVRGWGDGPGVKIKTRVRGSSTHVNAGRV